MAISQQQILDFFKSRGYETGNQQYWISKYAELNATLSPEDRLKGCKWSLFIEGPKGVFSIPSKDYDALASVKTHQVKVSHEPNENEIQYQSSSNAVEENHHQVTNVSKDEMNHIAKGKLRAVKAGETLASFSMIPDKKPEYVKWGLYSDISKIISSKMFYPTFITGMTGNGKSEMVLQACASGKRECIRINCTKNTGEEDFLGMYTLVDGSFVWEDGPVTMAMRRGAIVLLDELDSVSPEKAFSLQAVLEGKPVFIKKLNEVVYPKAGFNIIATANTKGRGSMDGRYIGTQMQNAAFLDRFAITLEQPYPNMSMERKILGKFYDTMNFEASIQDDSNVFMDKLVNWAYLIRESFNAGACDEIISTRRLLNIIKAYRIFNNKAKAIQFSINTFTDETKTSFMNFYSSLDDTVAANTIKLEMDEEIVENEVED